MSASPHRFQDLSCSGLFILPACVSGFGMFIHIINPKLCFFMLTLGESGEEALKIWTDLEGWMSNSSHLA
jgi:hypothetical protein